MRVRIRAWDMSTGLRLASSVGFLLGLSSCNLVVSEEPWFSAADAQPKPRLREGLWLAAETDCRVDESKPAERWPACASASFIRGDETWSMEWETGEGRGRRRTFAGWKLGGPYDEALLVANGDHLIAQVQGRGEPKGAAPADVDADSDGPAPPLYMYGAFRLQFGDDGKVIAIESWSVQCGPFSEPDRSPAYRRRVRNDPDFVQEANNVTDRPFPGLTVVDDNCTAASGEALRNAAVLSEALKLPTQNRWIREGWR